MLCHRCARPATYTTKDGKHLCHRNPAKCPACSTKGKPQKKKIQPIEYDGDHLCDYGCNKTAKWKFSNSKYCCNSNSANCEHIRIQAGQKIRTSKFIEVAPGITLGTLASQKAAKTKASDIDVYGNNSHQRNAEKVANIKRNKIDNDTGLNVHKLTAKKYQQWLKSEEGQKWITTISEKNKKSMNVVVNPTTGETEAMRRASIMVETKSQNIDELGLNGFERAHWKSNSKNSGFIEGIFWQYSNERRFLERAKAVGIIQNVTRGPMFKYTLHGKEKTFFADFLIEHKIFEVKSKYTLFGPKNSFLEKNIAKLFAAQRAGYDVYLVIDDETVLFKDFLRSISNLLE